MAFEILNEADSVLYVLAGVNRYPQAEPDKVDFDILAQGIDGEGVVSGCVVTPQGAPDMTVAVAAGVVRIGGTDVAYAGGNVNCGAADVGFPRFDLIAIDNAGVASAVAGVAADPPIFPAVPANSVIVAAVWRAANDNTITAADIVDKRCLLLGDALGTTPTLIGIVGGIATPNRSHHTLSAQAGAADDLDGLAVSSIITNGEIVIIRPDAGDTITVKHNALGGADARNILCIGNADIVCDDDHDFVICIYAAAIGVGSWMALGGGAGGGGTLDAAYDFGGAGAGRVITVDAGAVSLQHSADIALLELGSAANPYFQITRNGRHLWHDGAGGGVDVEMGRSAANILAMAAGDTFEADTLRTATIQDQAGPTARITLAGASPHVYVRGSTRLGDTLTTTVGFNAAPTTNDGLFIGWNPTIALAIQYTVVRAQPGTVTMGVNNSTLAVFAGAPTGNLAAGTTGLSVQVLQFIAGITGSGTATNTQLVNLSYLMVNFSGTITGVYGMWLHNSLFIVSGAATYSNWYGIVLGDPATATGFGASNRVVNFWGLYILDNVGPTGTIYLVEIGPATPYFRVVGGAAPGAALSNVWLDFGGVGLRNLEVDAINTAGAGFRHVRVLN